MQRLSENSAAGHFSTSLVKDRHFKFGPRWTRITLFGRAITIGTFHNGVI